MNEISTYKNSIAEFETSIELLFEKLYKTSDDPNLRDYSGNMITHSMTSYVNNQENQRSLSWGVSEESQSFTGSSTPNISDEILKFLSSFFSQLFNFLKEVVETWSYEILPKFFDIFISTMLKFVKSYKIDPILSFQTIYSLFHSIGMRIIYPETLKRVTAALQWRICSIEWLNIPFWKNYYQTLPIDINPNVKQALLQMIRTAEIISQDKLNIEKTQAEINREYRF